MRVNENVSWFLTAHWDLVPARRGDPLGLRAGADYFAELLAPDMSNATSDARWISILAWCLNWSNVAWIKSGGGDLSRSEDQRARYAWLRPLELLWVDRALEFGPATGQLRGRRSVERWRKSGRELRNFDMSSDQLRRYRQIGTYGTYRVVLRKVDGLTIGDGWTPGATALALAQVVNDSLPNNVRLNQERFESGTKWARWSAGNEARYWVEHGWQAAVSKAGGLLPTPDAAVSKRLPEEERRLLEPALFKEGSVRRLTAEVLANVKTARSHTDLCEVLVNSSALSKKLDPASLASLPAFSRFADAAMHAMRGFWDEINHNKETQAPALEKLARSTELQSRFDVLREASSAWLRVPGRNLFPHDQAVTPLAEAMRDAKSPLDQLRTMARHHQERGGGRRWFREQAGKVIPLTADTGIAASDYRFRLQSLCRLAAQCGVANMKVALDAVAQPEFRSVVGHEADDDEGETL